MHTVPVSYNGDREKADGNTVEGCVTCPLCSSVHQHIVIELTLQHIVHVLFFI